MASLLVLNVCAQPIRKRAHINSDGFTRQYWSLTVGVNQLWHSQRAVAATNSPMFLHRTAGCSFAAHPTAVTWSFYSRVTSSLPVVCALLSSLCAQRIRVHTGYYEGCRARITQLWEARPPLSTLLNYITNKTNKVSAPARHQPIYVFAASSILYSRFFFSGCLTPGHGSRVTVCCTIGAVLSEPLSADGS